MSFLWKYSQKCRKFYYLREASSNLKYVVPIMRYVWDLWNMWIPNCHKCYHVTMNTWFYARCFGVVSWLVAIKRKFIATYIYVYVYKSPVLYITNSPSLAMYVYTTICHIQITTLMHYIANYYVCINKDRQGKAY